MGSSQDSTRDAAWVISIVGCFWLLAAFLPLLIFTSFYQRLAVRIMDALEDPALLEDRGKSKLTSR